ncbi:MAG: cofactor-independent phosphoglycerate mutase [Muribaculaceae bacterium]|nr:cofactor-independent phosphoglycerate mutase [Muribaculaceae bacterium]
MRYVVILGDGMADEPIAELGGMTPLEAAYTPNIDRLAVNSRLGLLRTVPAGYAPGSEVAHLSLLGYNLDKVFEGRGSLEAASMGVEIMPGEMAMRCNIICVEDGRIKNHSAGHISDEEARILIDYLNENLADERVSLYPGVSYRHLIKIKGADKRIKCTPPHDVPGTPFKDVLVTAEVPEAEDTAQLINSLTLKSQELLSNHPVNLKRIAEGKDPANSIWTWSPGYKPDMETLGEKFGIKNGVVISAVDLIRGIGVYCGLRPIIVEGATGLWNTNYEGKAQAAINALKEGCDFVFLHVEASDEAGHEGDYNLKKRTIEALDDRICRPIIEAMKEIDEPVSIAVLPDHPTPCSIRTHSAKPVPFLIYRPGAEPDDVKELNEHTAGNGYYGTLSDDEFINEFLKK